jgi:hypothetical protein
MTEWMIEGIFFSMADLIAEQARADFQRARFKAFINRVRAT